jgi:hypothetical protein
MTTATPSVDLGSAATSGRRCGNGWNCQLRSLATIFGTITRRCLSGTASRSRPCRPDSATHLPPRRLTHIATCGPTPMTELGKQSTPCSASKNSLRGTPEGPRREVGSKSPSHRHMGDESVDKPDSVTAVAGRGDHPSATAVTNGLVRSTRRLGRAALECLRRRVRVLLILLQVGFTEPSQSPGMLVVSYTAVSPLPPCR